MSKINDLSFGLFGLAALSWRGKRGPGEAIQPVPVFTAQPQSIAMYQEGSQLSITGAAVTGATSLQWQRQNADLSWSNISGRTGASISVAAAGTEWAGNVRLMAVNGNSAPVYSNVVKVGNLYLVLVADLNGNAGTDALTQDADRYNYKGAIINGQRYYTARIYDRATSAVITPADWGLTASRAIATWTTTNAAVVPISSVTGTGQLVSNVPVPTSGATATITATYGNLKSNVKLTAP